MRLKLNESSDLCKIAAEEDNPITDHDWMTNSSHLKKILDEKCEFAYRLGYLEAVNDTLLDIDVVDGKVQIKITAVGYDADYIVEKILSGPEISTWSNCEFRTVLSDTRVFFVTDKGAREA